MADDAIVLASLAFSLREPSAHRRLVQVLQDATRAVFATEERDVRGATGFVSFDEFARGFRQFVVATWHAEPLSAPRACELGQRLAAALAAEVLVHLGDDPQGDPEIEHCWLAQVDGSGVSMRARLPDGDDDVGVELVGADDDDPSSPA